MKKKLRVVVFMGGRNSEYDVSISSGKEVLKNLDKDKYETFPLVVPKEGSFNVNSLLVLHPDFVFIAMHGKYGEDGTIQGMLDFLGIPYQGSGVLASALGINKIFFRKMMEKEGILSPKTRFINKASAQGENIQFGFPFVVKPANQGSSVGVSIVQERKDVKKALSLAFKYDDNVLVEEYLRGTEISCGILGNKKLLALPIVEIVPQKSFFDYESKYAPNLCKEIIPARISADLTKKIQDIALKVYQLINCQGFGRIDMIICNNKPYVLEINTIPGLTQNSLLPKEAMAAGINYSSLLDHLISYGLESRSNKK